MESLSQKVLNINDIVKFNKNGYYTPDAVEFCISRSITGRVIAKHGHLFEVDVGFGYNIFIDPASIDVVASFLELPNPED